MTIPEPPVAPRIPTVRRHHGDEYHDDLDWLRIRSDPRVAVHLEAENTYARTVTQSQLPLRQTIFEEITTRAAEADISLPSRRGGWWYYWRTATGRPYRIYCRIPVVDLTDWTPPEIPPSSRPNYEQVLLDCNEEVNGHAFFSVGSVVVSDSGDFLAHCTDTTGDEYYDLRIKDLRQNCTLPESIRRVSRRVVWAPDGSRLFYIRLDNTWRPYELMAHIIGTDPTTDTVVYHEADDQRRLAVSRSSDHAQLIISSGNSSQNETRLLDLGDPTAEPELLVPRALGMAHAVEPVMIHGKRYYLICHNHDAPNNMVALAELDQLGSSVDPQTWRTIIAHRDDVRVGGIAVTKTHMVLTVRMSTSRRVLVCSLERLTTPQEPAYQEDLTTVTLLEADFDAPVIRLAYTSFLSPARIYEYVLSTGELLVRKQVRAGPDYRATRYIATREWAISDDNTRVPMTLLRRNELQADGSNPCLILGYGAYGASQDPVFYNPWISLLDRGIIIAIAHVRGGGELGFRWHDAGRREQKRNSIADYLAATQHLIASGWAHPERIAAMGGSAGGLLVGAALNEAPDMYRACVLQVPFLDPLTSLLDPTYPLSAQEWSEWGNPSADPHAYRCIKSYSPYENLREQSYPRTLVCTGANDTRVTYAEAAKWVQRAREVSLGSEAILLIIAMDAGHHGRSGRYESWKEHAWYCAFVADALCARDKS